MDSRIATLSGHLTQTNLQHIKALLRAGVMSGRVNRISYEIEHQGFGTYAVKVYQKDRGMIACGGSKLRRSCYPATFTAATPAKWLEDSVEKPKASDFDIWARTETISEAKVRNLPLLFRCGCGCVKDRTAK